ncbi:ABC transporter G family member 23 [Amaranthus tricolor]|uniref:ABC transporter G family member 23 n=1 Tax=Amaranthus tricolor TaxID=29722 RepID=UPI0025867F00|nr:ABC transporter G family member 23 [Amaranthus tricolor]
MAKCFKQATTEEDSIILFSTSDSNEELSGCSSSSSSSSSRHHSPPPSATPGPSYNLSVKNLSYTLHQNNGIGPFNKPKPKIDILKSVSFTAQSSQILAIVGPSGTGKSTLLRLISGRVKEKDYNPNTISLNNHPITSPNQLRHLFGYVAQDDYLLPLLTVKETLMYRAKFCLRKLSLEEQKNRVENLLQELGLVQVENTFVGDEEHRGISGGERKRVSIGVELIHNPQILLLDEPTSGLDSSSALQVIEILSSMIMKSNDKIIIFSIHQPSYRMFRHINNFLILSNGLVVHNGSLKSLEERISQLGYQIPLNLNVLEFSMEIISKLQDQKSSILELQSNTPIKSPSSASSYSDKNFNFYPSTSEGIKEDFYNWVVEIMILCSRFWKTIYRTKQLFLARTMQALVGGLGLGSVYVKLGQDELGVGERLGLFAFSLSFLLSSTVEALPIYLQERKVIMKESSRKAYKISSYMIANTLVFLPFLLIIALLFSIPIYWIVGLNPSIQAFSIFVFIVWLIISMASSLVMFLSSISSDFIAGNSLICTVLGAFFLFSGYFIPKESIPKYWIFMYYLSLYRYPLDSLLVNEYWGMRNDCFSWLNNDHTSTCLMNGNDVLKNRGLHKDIRWENVGIMIGFFFFYRVICWVVLARRVATTTL